MNLRDAALVIPDWRSSQPCVRAATGTIVSRVSSFEVCSFAMLTPQDVVESQVQAVWFHTDTLQGRICSFSENGTLFSLTAMLSWRIKGDKREHQCPTKDLTELHSFRREV